MGALGLLAAALWPRKRRRSGAYQDDFSLPEPQKNLRFLGPVKPGSLVLGYGDDLLSGDYGAELAKRLAAAGSGGTFSGPMPGLGLWTLSEEQADRAFFSPDTLAYFGKPPDHILLSVGTYDLGRPPGVPFQTLMTNLDHVLREARKHGSRVWWIYPPYFKGLKSIEAAQIAKLFADRGVSQVTPLSDVPPPENSKMMPSEKDAAAYGSRSGLLLTRPVPTTVPRPARALPPMSDRSINPVPAWVQVGLSVAGLFLSYKMVKAFTRKPYRPHRLVEPGAHVLLIGDSLGEGLEKPLTTSLAAHGAQLHAMVKRGATAAYWAAHTDDRDGGYDHVLLSLGTNDARRFDVEDERDDLARLVGHLRSRGSEISWLMPPSFKEGALREKEQRFADMLAELRVAPLDTYGPQQDVSQDPERVHLTPNGYAAWAGQIVESLTRLR